MAIRDNLGGGSSGAVLDTLEEIAANTESGKAAGALAVKELNNSLNNLGVFINTDEIIWTHTNEQNWIATENCFICGKITMGNNGSAARISINNIIVAQIYSGTNSGYNIGVNIPVKKGQVVSFMDVGVNNVIYEISAYKMF